MVPSCPHPFSDRPVVRSEPALPAAAWKFHTTVPVAQQQQTSQSGQKLAELRPMLLALDREQPWGG